MPKKKRKLKLGFIRLIFFIIVFGILFYTLMDVYKSLKSNTAPEVEIVDEIKNYGYTLDENDPAYVSEIFSKLRTELNNEIVDEEKYATYVVQMFLADFYSLNSAVSKNDVGGVQFVFKDYKDDFLSSAKDTVYKYVESNIYDDRKQELPIVNDVVIDSIEQKVYVSDKKEDAKAFYVTATINYKTDLGYSTKAELVLVHDDIKLEIATMKS